jgi:fibronectin-binding autotransporter adhesin
LTNGNGLFIAQNGDLLVRGDISESGGSYGLSKNGAKTLILSGNNTYSGATFVNAGTLLVNGTLGAGGDIIVNGGASFGGTGIVSRALTLASGATLTPGAPGVGLLTINSTLTLSNNFVYAWDLGLIETDRVVATTVDFAGTDWKLQLGAADRSVNSNAVFVLMEWTTGLNTDALTNNVLILGGGKWVTDNAAVFIQGNQLLLTGVAVIPEPQVLMFWLCGAVVVFAARRRQRNHGIGRLTR